MRLVIDALRFMGGMSMGQLSVAAGLAIHFEPRSPPGRPSGEEIFGIPLSSRGEGVTCRAV